MSYQLLDQAAKLVENEVLANQTSLVWKCFEKKIFKNESISNAFEYISKKREVLDDKVLELEKQFEESHEEQIKEIYSWHTVTDWFADYLEKYGAPILRNEFGIWWGRTTCGQMICADWIIQEIAKEIYEDANAIY